MLVNVHLCLDLPHSLHLKRKIFAILRLGASVFRRGRAIMRTGSGGSLPLWTSKVTVRSGRSADGQLLHAHTTDQTSVSE